MENDKILNIKNMVCSRCIASVKQILQYVRIDYSDIKLGEVKLIKSIDSQQLVELDILLREEGFEIIDASTPVLITKIKSALIEVYNQDEIEEDFKISSFLTEKFPYDYSHLSRLFSQFEKDTIEHFVIRLRIEKAKELLTYNDKTVSEVAYAIGYASNAHFSRQFKRIVGVTPSQFRANPKERKSIEDI